jgi:hypothetical protein
MLLSRLHYANDLVVRVDVWLWALPPPDQTTGRNLRLWFDTAQVLSKSSYRGEVSGLRRDRAIGTQSELKRKFRCDLPRSLCFHKHNEAAQTRFDSPKFEP